jgi:SAM-dependent methyltransferase
MDVRKAREIRRIVRKGYARIAKRATKGCCGPGKAPCGSPGREAEVGRKIGYREKELKSVPDEANLGLGCGNPTALASLRRGETVLDLGSGAGFDCFLAANRVGPTGKVIGVDMTPEMVARAKRNARKGGYRNVDFRLGEIENLPVDDGVADVVISNCVINLVPGKRRAFREAFRALRPGGRMFVSDLVLTRKLPARAVAASSALVSCIAGASMKDRYLAAIRAAGFRKVRVLGRTYFPTDFITGCSAGKDLTPREAAKIAGSILSVNVTGFKPVRNGRRKS